MERRGPQPANSIRRQIEFPGQRMSGRWSYAIWNRYPYVLRAHHAAPMACDGLRREEAGGAGSGPAGRGPYLVLIAAVLVIALGHIYVRKAA